MSVNSLKNHAYKKLLEVFPEYTGDYSDNTLIKNKGYDFKLEINDRNCSYSLDLLEPINGLKVGLSYSHEVLSFSSELELEEALKSFTGTLDYILDAIRNDEVYIGHDKKYAYIVYLQSDTYMLRQFKKSILFGISISEKPIKKNLLKELHLVPLSSLK